MDSGEQTEICAAGRMSRHEEGLMGSTAEQANRRAEGLMGSTAEQANRRAEDQTESAADLTNRCAGDQMESTADLMSRCAGDRMESVADRMTGCAERMQKTADPRRDAGVSKIRRLLQKRRTRKNAKKIAEECKIPLVHTYHTVYEDYTHYFSPYKKWGRDMVQFLTRQISEKVDSMIAPSTKIETLLKDYGIHCPVSVIPSGIDLSKYDAQTRTDSRERIRRKYKMDRKTTVLLYVGRLAKEKNVEELLEYQQKVQESGTILMIVGGGPYLETLRKKAAELGVTGSVIFTGMVSPAEVASYYPAGDLFVSASTSETQGLTYAEALAAGLPLLCRRDQCLRAVVEEGKNGWQYRTEEEFLKDLKNWKEKEDDERRGMCSYAKQSAEIFSQKRFAGSMEQLYQRQIEEKQVEREKHLAKGHQYCILG